MKKNRMMRLASVLLVCVLLTTSVISGTFAKYTTTYTVTDSARVADWNITAFDKNADAVTEEVTFTLFDNSAIYDTKDADYNAGVVDTDIENGSAEAIIAPGSWGSFTFRVANNSEVNAEYTVTYDVDAAGVPLEWTTTPDDETSWKTDLSDVSTTALNMGNAATITVYWRWVFNGDDSVDTGLGVADPLAEPSVEIEVVVNQVD